MRWTAGKKTAVLFPPAASSVQQNHQRGTEHQAASMEASESLFPELPAELGNNFTPQQGHSSTRKGHSLHPLQHMAELVSLLAESNWKALYLVYTCLDSSLFIPPHMTGILREVCF